MKIYAKICSKYSSTCFGYPMASFFRKSSQCLKWCFSNGPYYTTPSHNYARCASTYNTVRTLLILGFRPDPWMTANELLKFVLPQLELTWSSKRYFRYSIKIFAFYRWIFCVLIKSLTRVSVCDCAARCGPFRKHFFNHCEDTLMKGPVECRNT